MPIISGQGGGGGGGGAPSGPAGGDLAGTYPNPSVFQGHLTDQAAPAAPAAGTLVLASFSQQGFSVPHVYDTQGNAIEVTRDNMFVARNVTGSSIPRGSAVYISGTTGAVPQVSLARANSAATMPAVGLTYDTMANNAYGRVLFIGDLERFDTSAFLAGDKLYVSSTVAGALVSTAPATFPQFIGFVLASGVGNGVIYVHSANQPAVDYGSAAGGDLTGTYPNPTVADVSILTTKGDLLARPAAAPATRLGVGADGQVLTADAASAPGIKWAAAPVTSVFGRSGAVIAVSGDYNLNQIGAATADYSLNSHKITSLANGAAATDAAAFGQIPTALALPKLFDSTLALDTASIDTGAGGISTAYDTLLIFVIARTDALTAFDTVAITFNNDGGANYDQVQEQNTNATVSGSNQRAATSFQLNARAAGSTNNYASVYCMQIPGYAQTTFFKSGTTQEANNDGTAANQNVTLRGIGYRSTTAISRMKLAGQGASKLKAGSRLLIYGT